MSNPRPQNLLRFRRKNVYGAPRYASTKATSPHIQFYHLFGRPILKTFLGAIFTYQVTYWLWTKLEMDEKKREKTAEIAALEEELGRVQGGKMSS